ncbi:MAG TPA: CBS domain-containing protein [Thermoanaerobaculia bacterium]|nr:CBS domain-containing protein [Thermoanaerobaculia bacterium]
MPLLRELVRDSRVLELGLLPAPRVPPAATVQQALQLLVRARRGAVVIVGPELEPLGIFTERDVLQRCGKAELEPEGRRTTSIQDLMSHPPVTIRRQATLLEAIAAMDERRHRHLVVVDRHGKLRGLLTTNDILQFLADRFPEDVVNLPPRLHQQYRKREGA